MASKAKSKASSSKASTTDLSKLLTTQQQRERFMEFFYKKSLTTPKYGNLPTFSSEVFDFPVLYKEQKVYDFISDSGSYYPDLVKAFYCNMKFENNVLTSAVKGIPISLTVQTLGECIKIPYEGVEIRTGYDAQLEGYAKKDFFYSISRYSEHAFNEKRRKTSGRLSEKPFWSAGILEIDDRMIHYFLCYVLVPKFSNHATINDLEMQLLYAIKNKVQVNWAYVILNHMSSHSEKSAGLPYARLLTKVFKKFKVNVTNELCYPMPPEDCEISSSVINRKMGVIYDHVSHNFRYIDHEDSCVSEPSQPAEPSQPTNQMLMDFMTQGFNRMDIQFAGLREEFGNLRQDVAGVSSRMDRFEAFQRGEGHDHMNQN
jgi:hypothetical protein